MLAAVRPRDFGTSRSQLWLEDIKSSGMREGHVRYGYPVSETALDFYKNVRRSHRVAAAPRWLRVSGSAPWDADLWPRDGAFSWFSKSLTFETTIDGRIAGSRYVRRPGFDSALPQVRGAADLCHLGAAPEISRNAANDVRLLSMQSHLELRAGAGHGRGLRRQRRAGRYRLKDRTDQAADAGASLLRSNASSSASQALALSTLRALMWPKPRIFAGSDAISIASA